ncbi:hypothetical protein DL96DRAFT_1551795 [Flagelloscypha sp. PMI_526]|nr:hypothetical protein DL96DRAFT_1551795 [Flagelloscypha sp. PMI_526]
MHITLSTLLLGLLGAPVEFKDVLAECADKGQNDDCVIDGSAGGRTILNGPGSEQPAPLAPEDLGPDGKLKINFKEPPQLNLPPPPADAVQFSDVLAACSGKGQNDDCVIDGSNGECNFFSINEATTDDLVCFAGRTILNGPGSR